MRRRGWLGNTTAEVRKASGTDIATVRFPAIDRATVNLLTCHVRFLLHFLPVRREFADL